MSMNLFDRQSPLCILAQLKPASIAGGGFTAQIPRGAWVTGIVGLKNTAFNPGGDTPTITLTVSDGTTTFVSAETLTGTGAITVDTTTKYFPNGGTITGVITEGASSGLVSSTAGDALIRIDYVQVGKGGAVQG